MRQGFLTGLILIFFLLVGCRTDIAGDEPNVNDESLSHFPPVVFPEDNTQSDAKFILGKELFYNKKLSRDGSISCATCHKPEFAFGDNLATTPGINNLPGTRNVPSLANVAYHPYFTREGGVPSLEMQVLVPIQEHNEFDFNIVHIVERLKNDVQINEMSLEAYGQEISSFTLVRAIANFEREIISNKSKYDNYLQGNESLSDDEFSGLQLFKSERLNCSSCHHGFDFTDYSFSNNGLYQDYEDIGRYRVTRDSSDIALFKTPSLRNLEFTSPYMHDGSLNTIDEVIDHYENRVQEHPNLDSRIKNFDLSENEKFQLKAFLKTLSDYSLLDNTNLHHE